MPARVHSIALPSELGDFTDELRQIFLDLGRTFGAESLAGECSPAVDVFETDDSVEITVDMAGVDRSAIRLMRKGNAILIAGEKPPRRVRGEATFHLVERGYGRFARVVRVARPCDMEKATATLIAGELRVSLPRIPDRRGRAIPIAVKMPTGQDE